MSIAPAEIRTSTDDSPHTPAEPTTAQGGIEQLSASRLDRIAIDAVRLGNRGRLTLCRVLRTMAETRIHLELGFPSVAAYAGARFCLGRTDAFECVRVGKTLDTLPLLRTAFTQGRIGWTLVKEMTRVTDPEHEAAWIELARRHGAERTSAELRRARRLGRKAPSGDDYGLPNLEQRFVLHFSMSEMHRVRSWLKSVAAKIRERTGREDVGVEETLLYLSECGRPAGDDCGKSEASDPPEGKGPEVARDRVVYQCCPSCRRSRVRTDDGWVEVDPGEVDRVSGSAEIVAIDGPTSPALRRKIIAREGGRCGNPRCVNRADHCHHIVFRSRGGRTDMANQVAICRTCHALVHAGLLEVSGQADGDSLRWTSRAGRQPRAEDDPPLVSDGLSSVGVHERELHARLDEEPQRQLDCERSISSPALAKPVGDSTSSTCAVTRK